MSPASSSNRPRHSRQPHPRRRPAPAGFRLLYDLIADINAGLTLQEVIDLAFDRLHRILPYHRMGLATYDPAADALRLAAVRSDNDRGLPPGYAAPLRGSSLARVVRNGRLRIINDLAAYARRHPQSTATRTMLAEGTRASLTVPLALAGRPVGVLFFSSRTPRAYRPAHAARVRGIVTHLAAIVEKARLTDALRATNDRLESILRDSADGILVLDMVNRLQGWNRGAERIFGFTAAEMIGQPFDRLVPPDLRASDELAALRDRIHTHGFITNYETRRLTKSGREILVNITSTLLRDAGGTPYGRSSIVRDVTDLTAMQAELARSRHLAALGELAASVAHEIRNPLAGISGAIQVLRDGLPAADPRRAIIGAILDHVTRLEHTVRDLLVFAKPWTPQKREVVLGDVVADSVASSRRQPRFAQIQFACDSPAPVVARVDPLMIGEVLGNLFENAAHAMNGQGQIRCHTAQDGPAACIRIADSGPGIPADVLPRLFTPFFTTKTSGNGLGLAICRKILEAHAGTIRIESPPGQGAQVTLSLPLR